MPEYYHSRMAELIVSYLTGSLSEEEKNELTNLIESAPEKRELFDRLTDESYYLPKVLSLNRNVKLSWNELMPELDLVPDEVHRTSWWDVVTAACIVGLMLGCFFFFQADDNRDVAEHKFQVFNLDTLKNGVVGFWGYDPVIKNDHGVVFPKTVIYGMSCVVKTQEELKYICKLSDGSEIFLTAGSRAVIHNDYGLQQRAVDLEGGAYFDIAKDTTRPFIVNTSGTNVEVLGTKFNVLNYKNRAVVKINLFEGKVKVRKGKEIVILNPGQQAILDKMQPQTKSTIDVNKDAYGFTGEWFLFRSQALGKVYEEIADAFGYKLKYIHSITQTPFETSLLRDNIETVFSNLRNTTKIDYKIDSIKKVITINP